METFMMKRICEPGHLLKMIESVVSSGSVRGASLDHSLIGQD